MKGNQTDPTSAFGFWVDHNGLILNVESFYSTHAAIANQYLKDRPGLKDSYSHVVMKYRRIKKDVFPADYMLIELGWIRVCKDVYSGFCGIEFCEHSVAPKAFKRFEDYLYTHCRARNFKLDICVDMGSNVKFYFVDGGDVDGVVKYMCDHIKKVCNEPIKSSLAEPIL